MSPYAPPSSGFSLASLIVRMFEAVVVIVALIISLQHFTTPLQAQINDLKQMTQAQSADAWDLYQRALFLEQQRDLNGAITLLNYAAELAPSPFTQAIGLRGMLQAQQGDAPAALDSLRQAVSLDPNHLNWQRMLCRIATTDRQFVLADQHCSAAIQLDPQDAQLVSNRCYARSYAGNFQGALDDCTRIINQAPEQPYAWNNRARAHLGQGNYEAVIQDATRSLQLGNNYAHMPLTNRALALTAQGRYQEAFNDLQAALENDPSYPDTYLGLAQWYDQQNSIASALAYYCEYTERVWVTSSQAVQDRVAQLGGCAA